jgi:diaminohydroxyphosphoribosylaminopyrimidine deaminase/5-amino-6-(5-phosphoribosylamino)uracil reductase
LGSAVVRTAREAPSLVVVGRAASGETRAALEAAGVEVTVADGLGEAFAALERRGVTSVLVEGGGVLAGRLLKEGLVDRLYLIVAPLWLGGDGVPGFAGLPGSAIADAPRWHTVERRPLADDTLLVLDRP